MFVATTQSTFISSQQMKPQVTTLRTKVIQIQTLIVTIKINFQVGWKSTHLKQWWLQHAVQRYCYPNQGASTLWSIATSWDVSNGVSSKSRSSLHGRVWTQPLSKSFNDTFSFSAAEIYQQWWLKFTCVHYCQSVLHFNFICTWQTLSLLQATLSPWHL